MLASEGSAHGVIVCIKNSNLCCPMFENVARSQVRDQVRRQAKQSGDARDLKLTRFQKLGIPVGDTYFVKLHAFSQHDHLAAAGTGLRHCHKLLA